MRLVHVIASLGPGGAQSQLRQIVPQLAARGYEQHVIVLLDRDASLVAGRLDGAKIRRLHGQHGLWATPFKLRTAFQQLEPDIVQAWLYHANVMSTLVAGHVPVIWNIRHSLHDLGADKLLTRMVIRVGALLSRQPSRIVFNSRRAAAQHFAIGYAKERAHTIENGYDAEHWAANPALRKAQRDELQLSDDTWVVGLIARYHPTKGIEPFLRAMRLVVRARADVRVVMAGAGMCTSNSALMAVIDEMGLRAQVTLLGHMDDVRGVLNAADIVVSASLGEASSNVVAEAMAVGATCIVTNVGESARLVGSFGVVLADSAPGSIAQAVLEVLAQERVAWRRRAFLASEHIRENYSLRQTVDTYDRLYQSVNGEQGCQAGA